MLDGVGIGALPDAVAFGDEGSNTLANTARAVGGVNLPHLQTLGLGNIAPIVGVPPAQTTEGWFGLMAKRSKGNDSITGHWELTGVISEREFPTYPNGFPEEVLEALLSRTRCAGYLGNKPASSDEIVNEFGDDHVRTGFPIIYTSGDSVFQIAAHEEVIPLHELYRLCRVAREQIMVGEHDVGRVVAQPFVGTSGRYTLSTRRKDYAVAPAGKTVLDLLFEDGVDTIGIGTIDELFCGRGLREKIHTTSNADGIDETVKVASRLNAGFIMTNLFDFDRLYGHRQDPRGFAAALEEFDRQLPRLFDCIKGNDVLIITADHGNDPTDTHAGHSREYVPLLCYSRSGKKNGDLGCRESFADVGKTIAEYFDLPGASSLAGRSFYEDMMMS